MSTSFERVQGDVNDTLVVQLEGVGDYTAATATAAVWTAGNAPTALNASVTNATTSEGVACGRCVVALGGAGGWLSTAIGSYLLEYQVTFSDGSKLTWPEHSPDELIVRADS